MENYRGLIKLANRIAAKKKHKKMLRSDSKIWGKIPLQSHKGREEVDMSRKKIFTKLRGLMADKFGVNESEIKGNSNIINDLGADSLDTVELAMGIEDKFRIPKISEDIDKLTTVNAIVDYIQEKSKK